MMGKFWKGVLLGALVGGAISLIDKETRDSVIENSKKVGNNVKEIVKNPKATYLAARQKINHLIETYQEINEDLQFIAEKAVELKEVGEEATKIITETKKVFEKNESDGSNTRSI